MSIYIYSWQDQAIHNTAVLNNLSKNETLLKILLGKSLKKPDFKEFKKQYPEPLKSQIQFAYDPLEFDMDKIIPAEAQISKTIRKKLSEWM